MRILITGINGFVGRFLFSRLLNEKNNNNEIFGLDLSSNSDLLDDNRYYGCDITNKEQVNELIYKIKPDRVYHLAALSNVAFCDQDPCKTLDINVNGFINLLESLRQNNINSRILLVSSAQVYGRVNKQNIPINEKTPLFPINEYAFSKFWCELFAKQYYKKYGMDIVILRSFNHIGPEQEKGFVVPDFCSQIAEIEAGEKESEINVGNINVYRDFLDVRDIVEAYILAMEKCKSGNVYNICSSNPVKIKEMLDILISFSNIKIKVKSLSDNMRLAEIDELYGDNKVFVNETGWKIKFSLEQTLRDTLDYWRGKDKCVSV